MYASRTISSVAFVLAALATGQIATAQVAIEMTTTAQAHCLATTDAAGLRLVPGGTNLEATGVVLTGEGCQAQGGGSSADFETTVTVQPTATVPATVNVQWSASDDAERCTFGGTAASGWPIGSTACQGAACAGSHITPVSLTAAGSYNFAVTCTNATGFASGALTATGAGGDLPPSPANFVLTAPASGATQSPFQVSWAVTGATSCTGSASLGGNSINLAGWTTVTTPTSPRAVTATVAGTYELRLTCSNSFGSVSSQPRNITITQGEPSCPAGRLTIGSIGYPPLGNNPVLRQNVDLTDWDNIWGHTTPTDPVVPWPGIAGTSPVIMAMGRTQYIAAKFHVPAGTPSTWTGFYKNVSNYGGLNITTSISEVCGDFAPAQAGCLKENIPPSDSTTLYWRMQNPTNFHCALEAGRDYYLNIKNTDPAQANGNCPAGNPTCKVHILNNATTN